MALKKYAPSTAAILGSLIIAAALSASGCKTDVCMIGRGDLRVVPCSDFTRDATASDRATDSGIADDSAAISDSSDRDDSRIRDDATLAVRDASAIDMDATASNLDARAPVVEGCADGIRTGFVEQTIFPNIAGCGPRTGYEAAVAASSTICGPRFHACTPDDPRLLEIETKPAPFDTVVWLQRDDACTGRDEVYIVPECQGMIAASAFVSGTGGCSASGDCGEGYRPAMTWTAWEFSGRFAGDARCRAHFVHLCGYPGGSAPVTPASVACCRD